MGERQRSEVEEKLYELAKGPGVRRANLYEALGVHLRHLWGIENPSDPVLEMVEWQFEWLIGQIRADETTPALKRAVVVEQCQHAARATFNVSIPELADIAGVVQRREWLHSQGGPSVSEIQRDMRKRVVPQFVAILGGGTVPSREFVLRELARRAEPNDSLIPRPGYRDAVSQLLAAGNRLIWLWGEPGTGKTVLAAEIGASLGNGQVLLLRASDAKLLQRDIRDSLAAEAQEHASLTDDQCLTLLRNLLSSRPKSDAIVLDDVENRQFLDYVLPKNPSIPVIVTSRVRPQVDMDAAVHIREFTEDQALMLVRQRLKAVDEGAAKSLVQLLGARPLALDHALRFLHECPDVSLEDLLQALAKSAVRTLDNVTAPSEANRNLAALYRMILGPLLESPDVHRVLDAFLAVTGGYGASVRELLFVFLRSNAGGNLDRLTFRAALRRMAYYGLVRDEGWALVMHSLTFDILRELRGAALYEIEQDYFWFLLGGEVREYTEDKEDGRYWAWLLKSELLAASDLMPGWKCVMCVDRRTWLALRNHDDSGIYLARYEVRPDVGIYKLDYRTGQRAPVSLEDGRQLYNLVDMVGVAVRRVHFPDA